MASSGQMNGQCFDAIEMFVIALEKHFQNYELTNAFWHYVCTILKCILMLIPLSFCTLISSQNIIVNQKM